MSASKRISKVFLSAHEFNFDNSSKIVFMSDCHRGTGSWADSFADNNNLFYAALNHYYKENFTYIEIGDGDELWENKKMSDIISTYKNIFELLCKFKEQKRLYMLLGNHDMDKKYKLTGKRLSICLNESETGTASLFIGMVFHEGLILNYKNTDIKIFLIHGNQADFINDPLWKFSKFFVRYLWRPLEVIGVNDPTSASKSKKRKQKVEDKLKQWSDRFKQMIIAGHTHRYTFPSPGNTLYFNDGCCIYRGFITAIEIQNGYISLVKWSTKIRDDGTLYVGRDILNGPVKLLDYFKIRK